MNVWPSSSCTPCAQSTSSHPSTYVLRMLATHGLLDHALGHHSPQHCQLCITLHHPCQDTIFFGSLKDKRSGATFKVWVLALNISTRTLQVSGTETRMHLYFSPERPSTAASGFTGWRVCATACQAGACAGTALHQSDSGWCRLSSPAKIGVASSSPGEQKEASRPPDRACTDSSLGPVSVPSCESKFGTDTCTRHQNAPASPTCAQTPLTHRYETTHTMWVRISDNP